MGLKSWGESVTEAPEGQRSGSGESLPVRVTCKRLPFLPNGDRVPFSYMLHRWGMAQFIYAPGGLVVGALFARLGDWWFAVPCLALGVYASVLSALMTKGLWTLQKRRRARAAQSDGASGSDSESG